MTLPFNLFYNAVSGSYNRVQDAFHGNGRLTQLASSNRVGLCVRESPNKGKDIGGKLLLMDAYLRLGIKSDYILLLHDKHSPYHSNGSQWQQDLFRIAEKQYRDQVLEIFRNDLRVGIVASQNAIRNEADNDQRRDAYTDSAFIQELKSRYGIQPPGLQYVAGTMFWVRASLFEAFFSVHHPLQIRGELEEGNVLDADRPTRTHAWERLLCWLVTSRGYKIKGV